MRQSETSGFGPSDHQVVVPSNIGYLEDRPTCGFECGGRIGGSDAMARDLARSNQVTAS
jgi:hypothetical protein